MSTENITVSCRLVHPADAEEMVRTAYCPWQRPLRQWYVDFLATLMQRQAFMAGTQIHLVHHDGACYLVNGQHTLSAIAQAKVPYLLSILETKVETLQEVRTLYGTHDRGLQRTLSDSYQAEAATEMLEVSKAQVNAASACMPLLMSGFARNSMMYGSGGHMRNAMRDAQVRWACMKSWAPALHAYIDDIRGAIYPLQKAFMRAGTMAVALATYRHTGEDASLFWRAVAHDEEKAPHPTQTLSAFLIGTPAKSYSPPHYARFVASAWNTAWREATLLKLHASDMDKPITIAGTPHMAKDMMTYLSPTWEILDVPLPYGEHADAA